MSGFCTHGISLDSPCVRCALTAPVAVVNPPRIDNADRMARWMDLSPLSPAVEPVEAFTAGVESERSRCREIILELFGREWAGNKCLEWLDSGLTVEQLKEGK